MSLTVLLLACVLQQAANSSTRAAIKFLKPKLKVSCIGPLQHSVQLMTFPDIANFTWVNSCDFSITETELTNGLFLIPLSREHLTTICPLVSPPALPVETTHGKLASWPPWPSWTCTAHSISRAMCKCKEAARHDRPSLRVRAGHALQLLEGELGGKEGGCMPSSDKSLAGPKS